MIGIPQITEYHDMTLWHYDVMTSWFPSDVTKQCRQNYSLNNTLITELKNSLFIAFARLTGGDHFHLQNIVGRKFFLDTKKS